MKIFGLFIVLLIIRRTPGQSSSAQEDQSGPAAGEKSPQILYMKMLRETLTENKQLPTAGYDGSLLAASIEAEDITGPGNVTEGFAIQSGSKYSLDFSIPGSKEASYIQGAELWIFPEQSSLMQNGVKVITLFVSAQLEHASRPRREVLQATWDTQTDCFVLNLTSLTRKISRNLAKNELKQANVTISIEIVSIVMRAEDDHFADICHALAEKQTRKPFLVIKYYVDQSLPMTHSLNKKRSTAQTPSLSSNCSLVPLVVNLTKIFGSFILDPKYLDISDCSGSCNIMHNEEQFTMHARIIQRFKTSDTDGGNAKRDICCVPSSYKTKEVLLKIENGGLGIVRFEDMIVTGCSCR